MAQGAEALLFVQFQWKEQKITSRKECAQNFRLWTAVSKQISETHMRELQHLSVYVTVLVTNETLVPLHRLLSLRILDISSKLDHSPEL